MTARKRRVKQLTAETVALPPTEWFVKEVNWLLDQETFQKNYERIPLNNELYESIDKHGIIAPILTMNNWYPITGSQRLRVCSVIRKLRPKHKVLTQKVRVARITHEVWNAFYMWGDREFQEKAVQVYFQCIEIAWKSRHYIYEKDFSGVSMEHFEEIGDRMKWKDRDGE